MGRVAESRRVPTAGQSPDSLGWLQSVAAAAKRWGRAEDGLRLVVGAGRVGARFGKDRVDARLGGEDGEAPPISAPGATVRHSSRAPWRPSISVTLAASLVVVLLGVFAYVLASSQATSRHEAQQRFAGQATIAAALTEALFSTVDAPEARAAGGSYGSARITPGALAALVKRSQLAYAFIAGPGGQVLAASPGTPASALGAAGRESFAVRRALAGQPWLSDLLQGPNHAYLIEQAVPFSTSFGRRVEVLGYPAATLTGILSRYLVGAIPDKTAHGFVLDGSGRLVGTSVPSVGLGQLIGSVQFLKALESNRGAYHATTGDSRYLVAAPIRGSDWRVAITEPTSSLYPAVVGSEWWVMWAVFVAFALAAMSGLYLLSRSLRGAAQLVEQAHVVEEANVALSSANAELDAFSYSVSHDLRAPLRAIDGFSLIVVEEDQRALSDSQRRYLQLVRDNTQTMGTLIDDLLAFSRLANQPLERTPVATAELVAEVQSELIASHNGRAIEFTNGDLPTVEADPVLLRRVFVNLLENAVKYSRDRQPAQVVVDSETRDRELVFLVRDNGAGFDMRYAEKLFQVFQRLHRAEDYEGTGVGLAIVQRIVTRHGGRVWAEGELGTGATFYFTIAKGAP
jgi:signal transduction histidine kinase